jgi:hypothetical protein
MQYHQDETMLPRPEALSQSVGVVISKREIQRLLTAGQDGFLAENRAVSRDEIPPRRRSVEIT